MRLFLCAVSEDIPGDSRTYDDAGRADTKSGRKMTDPRNPSYITYTQADLVWMGILKNVCSVLTMKSMEEQFNEEQCIHTLRIFSGDHRLEEMPHCDTLNYYLEKLSPSCLSDLRRRMMKSLIRNKSFYKGRLLGKYWRVIIDGTGLFY